MKLKIGTKLYAGFGLALVVMAVLSVVAFNNISNLTSTSASVSHTHEVLEGLSTIVSTLKDAETGQRGYVITREDRYLEPYNNALVTIYDEIEHVRELTIDNSAQTARIDEIRPLVDAKFAELLETIDLRRDDTFEAALAVVLTDAGKQIMDDMRVQLDAMDKAEQDLLISRSAAALDAAATAKMVLIAGTVGAVIVLAALAFYITRGITSGVNSGTAAARRMSGETLPQLVNSLGIVANGDLTERVDFDLDQVEVSSSDEIGEIAAAFNDMSDSLNDAGKSFNDMVQNMANVVGQVADTANEVASASEQLAAVAEQAGSATQNIAEQAQGLSKGAEQQGATVSSSADSVKQLGSAITQIAAGTKQQTEGVDTTSRAITEVAKNAQEAAEGSQVADEAARKGLGIVEQTVEGMGQINSAVRDVAARIGDLGEQSAEIGKIVAVIDDIAAQTNLLALNAAIEAARAGEQGRGFAVVADEVRQLAERVTTATSEIAGLIDGVQKGVEESVKATERGTAEVEEGTKLAAEAGDSLNEIQEAVLAVTRQVELISSAAEEVTASSDEMVKSIESVSAITEQTTAATEEMAESNGEVQNSMSQISEITEQSGQAIEQSSASTEELTSQVEEVVASSSALGDMAGALTKAVGVFKLDDSKEVH